MNIKISKKKCFSSEWIRKIFFFFQYEYEKSKINFVHDVYKKYLYFFRGINIKFLRHFTSSKNKDLRMCFKPLYTAIQSQYET